MLIIPKLESSRPKMVAEVCRVVRENFYAPQKLIDWESTCNQYIRQASFARTQQDIIDIIQEMLGTLDVSHLRLIEPDVYDTDIFPEFKNVKRNSFGFDLFETNGSIYVRDVIDGSAAHDAGVVRGDIILKIDGARPNGHRLLRPSGTGDGFHIYPEGPVKLTLRRGRRTLERTLTPKKWNHIDATARSAHLEPYGDIIIAYIHLWHMCNEKILQILESLIKDVSSQANGLLLDLRGFGGNIEFPKKVMGILSQWNKPIVAIVDSETRSSKEMLAYMLKRDRKAVVVGERTKGVVLGSHFLPISDGYQVLIPTIDCASFTDGVSLEKNGVKPDVKVQDKLGVRDPILEGSAKVLRELIG